MCVGTSDCTTLETGAEYYSNRISDARYSCSVGMCILFYSFFVCDRISMEDSTILHRNHNNMFEIWIIIIIIIWHKWLSCTIHAVIPPQYTAASYLRTRMTASPIVAIISEHAVIVRFVVMHPVYDDNNITYVMYPLRPQHSTTIQLVKFIDNIDLIDIEKNFYKV